MFIGGQYTVVVCEFRVRGNEKKKYPKVRLNFKDFEDVLMNLREFKDIC